MPGSPRKVEKLWKKRAKPRAWPVLSSAIATSAYGFEPNSAERSRSSVIRTLSSNRSYSASSRIKVAIRGTSSSAASRMRSSAMAGSDDIGPCPSGRARRARWSGASDRFSLDQMDDPHQDAGSYQRGHELYDDAPAKPWLAQNPEDCAEDPASQEASYHPEEHVPDDAVATTNHDLAREPAGYATDDDAADDAHNGMHLLKIIRSHRQVPLRT